MPFVRTDTIKPGLNGILIRNISETDLKLFIQLSKINTNTFKYFSEAEMGDANLLLTSKTIQACISKPFFNCEEASEEAAVILAYDQPFKITVNDLEYQFNNVQDFLQNGLETLDLELVSPEIFIHLSDVPVENYSYFSSKPYPLLFEESIETQFYPNDSERVWLVTQPKVIEEVETSFNVLDASIRTVGDTIVLRPIIEEIQHYFSIQDIIKGRDLKVVDWLTDTTSIAKYAEKIQTSFKFNDVMLRNNVILAYDNKDSNKLKTVFNLLDSVFYTVSQAYDDKQNNLRHTFQLFDPVIEGRNILIGCSGAITATNHIQLIPNVNNTNPVLLNVYLNNSQSTLNSTPLTIQELKNLLLSQNIEIEIIEDI